MNISLSLLTQNGRVCGFLFTSNEVATLQQFKEAFLNKETFIDYSNPDRKLLVVIDGKSIQCSSLSNKQNRKLYGFLCEQPELSIGETGAKTSFALIGDAYQAETKAETLFLSTIEIMLEEKVAA